MDGMPKENRAAIMANLTAQIREKGESFYWFDWLMEVFGIKAGKQLNKNPHKSTLIDVRYMSRVVCEGLCGGGRSKY